jgi:anti-anti-sigma factor
MEPRSWEVTIVRVESELNLETVASVKRQLTSLLGRCGHVILDLREATLDSSGLGAVLSLQRHLELQERRLLVIARDPRFFSLLDSAGAGSALAVFPDADRAIEHARLHSPEAPLVPALR